MSGESTSFVHHPVMVSEVEAIFQPVPPGVVVDATVGGGGHAECLLDADRQRVVIGLDRDAEALNAAATRLRHFGSRIKLARTTFDHLTSTVQELGHKKVAGVLFDLGVSSPQLDRAGRGFSYRASAPLDMRMDQREALTAADVVNTYSHAALARVLREFGDERFSDRIASAIIASRPITDTLQLAQCVREAIPAPARRRGGHPAKRSFQALRIEVNRELAMLAPALDQAIGLLVPGGRVAAIAYHSGEDRIVKERFRFAATGGCTCPHGLPCQCGAVPTVRLLKRGAWRPAAQEISANPRAESARLRAVERLGHSG